MDVALWALGAVREQNNVIPLSFLGNMLESMEITNKDMKKVLDGRDPSVRFQDDLYRAVNGAWLASTEIPDDLGGVGSFIDLRLKAEEDVRDIVEELASQPHPEGEAAKVAALYRSWMDVENVNKDSQEALLKDLYLVQGARTHDELSHVVGSLLPTGVSSFFDVDVDADLNDPNSYITFLGQAGLGLPDEAYYHEDQHADTLAAYEKFMPTMARVALRVDEDEAERLAAQALRVEKAIAATHMNVVDARDTDKINNVMSWDEFTASAPGFNWEAAFAAAGFEPAMLTKVLVLNPDTLAASAQVWERTDLEELRAYTAWRVILARASYLSEEADRTQFDFYGRTLAGSKQQRERWKRGMSLIDSTLGEAVGKLYVERHFPADHKAKMEQLVADLLEAYRRSIRALDWMGEETKQKALEKVDSFTLKIGYPDQWRDYSALELGEHLVENIRAVSRFEFARSLRKLGKPMDRNEWYMNPQTVNAYYNPVWNEIVFPAAILQFPFFEPDRDAALNYGGIGAVIGHEIGHGFDDQGSKYAADGSLTNWWTERDREEFEKRTSALVAQYDAYTPAELEGEEGFHVKGALTLGENIGDLGGLSIGLKAYAIALERDGKTLADAGEIDGFTPTQRVFLSYARIWQNKQRKELFKQRIATDPHSPAQFRCNGVVKNVDAFAEAFSLGEGDALYLPSDKRVRIW